MIEFAKGFSKLCLYALFSFIFIPFFLEYCSQVLRFSRNSFEKRPVAVFWFSKELRANPGNLPTYRKWGISLTVVTSFW
jgi:hypothetical protein